MIELAEPGKVHEFLSEAVVKRAEAGVADSYLESTEFGTVLRPVQPAYEEGNRIGVNMQLEDTGLRAIISWSKE